MHTKSDPTERGPIRANSVGFEYVYVANQRCSCGGYFAAVSQELRSLPSGPVDHVAARCESCGVERAFDFDIGSFFGQFDRYGGFQETEGRFRQAMAHLRAGRLLEAESALRAVVDPEEGEPAFAWAHYHLGRVLLMSGRPEEAATALARAVAIQPLEPEIHEALGRALRAAGRNDEAEAHVQEAAALRARFGG